MIIPAYNPSTDDLEQTYIASYTPENSTTFATKNAQNFAEDQRVLIGEQGTETAEILTIDTVNADLTEFTTTTASKFVHETDDPVYILTFDKVRFYRAPTIGATYTLMATKDVDVDNADKVTNWNDEDALAGFYYKISFYHSITEEESELSDPIETSGFDRKTIGKVIDETVRRVRDTDFTVFTVDEYLDMANEVNDDLLTQAHRPYRFLKTTALLGTTADQAYIDLPENFWKFNHVFTAITSGNANRFRQVTPLSAESFYSRYDNDSVTTQNNIQQFAIDEDRLRIPIWPTPLTSQSDVIKLSYYKIFDQITDVGSVVETPNTLIYKYKFMAEYYSARAESDRQWITLATKYEQKYTAEIGKMQRVNRLDAGTPRSFVPPGYRRRRRYHL